MLLHHDHDSCVPRPSAQADGGHFPETLARGPGRPPTSTARVQAWAARPHAAAPRDGGRQPGPCHPLGPRGVSLLDSVTNEAELCPVPEEPRAAGAAVARPRLHTAPRGNGKAVGGPVGTRTGCGARQGQRGHLAASPATTVPGCRPPLPAFILPTAGPRPGPPCWSGDQ